MHMNQSELEDLWQRQHGGMSEKGTRQLESDITQGYKVGDLVRVTHLKRTFEKGFMPRWQREVHERETGIQTTGPERGRCGWVVLP